MVHKVKILAVDDRPENLLALEAALSSPQYEVIAKQSGEEALRYLLRNDTQDVAVILMDVQMPGLNGFETVELIKRRPPCAEIPVIFLTAISMSLDHMLHGYQVGSVDYLFKPIHPELLKLKVGAFVQLHRYHRKIKEQGELLETMVEERTRELVAANEKLHKSQERFKKMFMSSPCMISIRRLSDGKYIDVNQSWKTYTGFGDEVIGHTARPLQETIDPAEETGGDGDQLMRNVRFKYVTKSGEARTGLMSTEIVDIDGDPCVLEVALDITEKVQYEIEMTRLAQLNLIGEMAAGIAHEIRNPMTTIRGFLQLSKETGGRMESEYIDIMLEELDRANGIITEYLSLAKNKQSDLQPRSLDCIIESLYPLIQAEAMMSGKHVHAEYGGPHANLMLDEREIRQLILNMSMNGLEAMAAGGVLTIHTSEEQGNVLLTVADQGSGISEEHVEKLGRPFFTTKEKGTGLGLATCYSIARRHHATIDVTSDSRGTTFYIRFPVMC